MGFHVNAEQFDTWLTEQQKHCDIYAPKCFPGGNTVIYTLENQREKYSSLRFCVNSKEISPGFVVCRPSRIPLSASWTATWSTFLLFPYLV